MHFLAYKYSFETNLPFVDHSPFVVPSPVADSKKDFLIRKAQAWAACNKLHHIWKSNISNKTKISFFRACVESILLYGVGTWTMKRDLEKRLDGTYTRLLMRVQNMNWRNHPTKEEIYKDIPPISDTVRMRRNRFAGHCHRSQGEIISDVPLCGDYPTQSEEEDH